MPRVDPDPVRIIREVFRAHEAAPVLSSGVVMAGSNSQPNSQPNSQR